MSRIQTSIGLITGIPIEDTVNKLMAVAAQPRDLITSRNKLLQSERLSVSRLASLVVAFQFEVNRLGTKGLYESKTVTSSDPTVLNAVLQEDANPAAGTYKFRALQTASSQQLVSSSFTNLNDLATDGTLSLGFGGFIDKGISLDQLNSGAGVGRGQIRITDRNGDTADIDLRAARTVDDVLNAINHNTTASITAVVDGDKIKLVDHSGGSSNLKVQQIGTGTTAANLGLSGINVADDSVTGTDIFKLYSGTKLSTLNDGTGVQLKTGSDLHVALADGSTLSIELGNATTLGDVVTAINAASPTQLSATIASDGNRLELTDLTTGTDEFAVTSVSGGTAAENLGLTTEADGDTITGRRLVAGLRDTLVSSLRGGAGLGTLGDVLITNRNNVGSTVHLVGAETVGEIVAKINDQATGVTAAVNAARNGITLTDNTGGTLSNFIVANGDANNSATALGLVVNTSATSANSGTLARQQIGRATLLSDLNNGQGIDLGDLRIIDSNGVSGAVDLNTLGNEAETVGDLIDRINAISTADVEAKINDDGNGVIVIDHAGGSHTLQIQEIGNHTTAADLHLLGSGVSTVIDSETVQVIDGSSVYKVDLSGLNDEGASIQLSSLNHGEGVQLGSFRITDTDNHSAVVVLNASAGTFKTVADVIDAINATSIGVEARINDDGNGILLFDTAHGSGTLKVEELAGGTTAADLGIDGDAESLSVDSVVTSAIDGSAVFAHTVAEEGLAALAARINNLSAGVTASTVFDGAGYRLALNVDESGAGNELLIDGLEADLSFDELSEARDAVVEYGGNNPGSGVVITSSTNSFNSLIPGVDLEVVSPSTQTVTVNVGLTQTNLLDTAQDFVDAYNSIRSSLDDTTDYNADDNTAGILFGSTAALRVDSDLSRILSGRIFGTGQFTSFEAVGISLDDKGKLSLDKDKLQAAFDADPDALQKFFTDKNSGVAARLTTSIGQLTGEDSSLLDSQGKALDDKIQSNQDRIDFMNDQLGRQRERLLNQFALLESTVAKLQEGLKALSALQIIPPITSTRSS